MAILLTIISARFWTRFLLICIQKLAYLIILPNVMAAVLLLLWLESKPEKYFPIKNRAYSTVQSYHC